MFNICCSKKLTSLHIFARGGVICHRDNPLLTPMPRLIMLVLYMSKSDPFDEKFVRYCNFGAFPL